MRKIGIKDCSLFFGYALLFYICRQLSVSHWLLSSGLRFGTLLFLAIEYWPIILAADCLGSMAYRIDMLPQYGLPWLIASAVLPSFAATIPAYVLRRSRWLSPSLELARHASLLIKGGIAVAMLGSTLSVIALQLIHYSDKVPKLAGGPVYWFMVYALGNYLGVLMVVPAVVTFYFTRKREFRPIISLAKGTESEAYSPLWVAFAVIAALLLVNRVSDVPEVHKITGVLMFFPAVWATYKRGWFGAVPVSIAANLALQLTMRHFRSADLVQEQILMALGASGTLAMGAAITELRLKAIHLAWESGKNRDLARRNLQWGEAHVRRSAVALEKAYQKLQHHTEEAEDSTRYVGGAAASAVVRWNIGATSRKDLHQTLSALKLEELECKGIRLALACGPLSQQFSEAQIGYAARVPQRAYDLPTDIQVVLYRVSYELAMLLTNQFRPYRVVIKARIVGPKHRSVVLSVKIWPGNADTSALPGPCLTMDDVRAIAKTFNGTIHDRRDADQPSVSLMLRDV